MDNNNKLPDGWGDPNKAENFSETPNDISSLTDINPILNQPKEDESVESIEVAAIPPKKFNVGIVALIAALVVLIPVGVFVGMYLSDGGDGVTSTGNGAAIDNGDYISTDSADGTNVTEEKSENTKTKNKEPIKLAQSEMYDYLFLYTDIWNKGIITGGTLIDLDFDGNPEFLVCYGESKINEYSGNPFIQPTFAKAFRLTEDGLNEIAEFPVNYKKSYVFSENRNLFLYTDEYGKKNWAVPHKKGEIGFGWSGLVSDEPGAEFYFSLYDFTDSDMQEQVKFSAKYTGEEHPADRYIYFINGNQLTPTVQETQEFNEIYARYLVEKQWFERDPKGYLDVGYYETDRLEFFDEMSESVWEPIYPVYARWAKQIGAFEEALTETAYKIDPNIFTSGYDEFPSELNFKSKSWHDSTTSELKSSVERIITAYFTNNTDYLIDKWAFEGGGMAKPVIYLYPEEVTDVNVRVKFPDGRFTCTYPDYGDGWNVIAHPDGTIINKVDGREYSYLYWEGESSTKWDLSNGFVVKGSDTVAFLQDKLEYLGLTPQEYNEFIVYWLPLMQNNPYNLITFQSALYEKSALLDISPKPDSLLRVFMVYKPLKDYIEIPEQELESFNRKGFSVIEWGGTCVK